MALDLELWVCKTSEKNCTRKHCVRSKAPGASLQASLKLEIGNISYSEHLCVFVLQDPELDSS